MFDIVKANLNYKKVGIGNGFKAFFFFFLLDLKNRDMNWFKIGFCWIKLKQMLCITVNT